MWRSRRATGSGVAGGVSVTWMSLGLGAPISVAVRFVSITLLRFVSCNVCVVESPTKRLCEEVAGCAAKPKRRRR